MFVKNFSSLRNYYFCNMILDKYIAQLLYRHQCVTVSGFGSFICENQSSFLDKTNGIIYPPKKKISFNAHVKNNDGLLANHIAMQEGIAYDYALEKINNEVLSWNTLLSNKNTLSLNNIGEITKNNEGNLVFEPHNVVNYLTDSFGLSSINTSVIYREILKQSENENFDEVIDEETNVVAIKSSENKKPSYLKYAAAAVLFSLGATFSYKAYYNYKIEQETLIVHNRVQERLNKEIQQATFALPQQQNAVAITLKEQKLPYHLIAGAFRDYVNADKLSTRLLEEGYVPRMFENPKNKLIMVEYASFKTSEEALAKKAEIESRKKPVWLMVD